MSQKSLNGFDANAYRIINVGSATLDSDAPNLGQIKALIAGRSPKDDVIVAPPGNINLASLPATIDGVTLTAGQRFLAFNQTTGSQNGIYDYTAAGSAATRSSDANSITSLSGAVVAVQRGTNADKIYLCTNDDTDTLGTTAIAFTQVGQVITYTAGNGLSLTGSTFAVLLDTSSGLIVSPTGLKVDPSVVTRKYAADCAATTNPQTFTHNLATSDVTVTVREASTGALVFADVTVSSANAISVNFGAAPTAGQYRVIVLG